MALAVDANGNPLLTDGRGSGFPRVVDESVDIGAFELAPASSVYVSSAYASDAADTPVTWSDGSTHYVGYDAFSTVQAGVNAVAVGGTVSIAAGTYTEQVTVSQNMTLTGAGSSTTFLEPPAGVNSGDELEIESESGVSVSLSGITVDPVRSMTAIDVNGGSLNAAGITVTGYSVGVSIENGGAATITDSTISATTGIVVGSAQATPRPCRPEPTASQVRPWASRTTTLSRSPPTWTGGAAVPARTVRGTPAAPAASGWQRELELMAGRRESQRGR